MKSFRYNVRDPFVFCVHHLDYYPAGNEGLGPVDSLEGINMGNDFDPYYKMLWKENIPVKKIYSGEKIIKITVIAGEFQGTEALEPTPDSWAADQKNQMDIFLMKMEENTEIEINAKSDTVNRSLYLYEGSEILIKGKILSSKTGVFLSNEKLLIENKYAISKILILQGEPVNEPVFQYGPYVMNTYGKIRKAYEDYDNTGFGGWRWSRPNPVHSRAEGRNENHN